MHFGLCVAIQKHVQVMGGNTSMLAARLFKSYPAILQVEHQERDSSGVSQPIPPFDHSQWNTTFRDYSTISKKKQQD